MSWELPVKPADQSARETWPSQRRAPQIGHSQFAGPENFQPTRQSTAPGPQEPSTSKAPVLPWLLQELPKQEKGNIAIFVFWH